MMRNLPVPVSEEDIDDMFDFADKDKDGKINYRYKEAIFGVEFFYMLTLLQRIWDHDQSKSLQTSAKVFFQKFEKIYAPNQRNGKKRRCC